MEDKYIKKLKKIFGEFFKDEKVEIILFGSRARGNNYSFSDVDIGLIPRGEFDAKKLILLREKLENLNIPYKVEVINLKEVSEDFRNEIMKGAVTWKD